MILLGYYQVFYYLCNRNKEQDYCRHIEYILPMTGFKYKSESPM